MKLPRIVIIGGGASGLACASRLCSTNQKFDITIVEATNRLGGRVFTEEKGKKNTQTVQHNKNKSLHEIRVVYELA